MFTTLESYMPTMSFSWERSGPASCKLSCCQVVLLSNRDPAVWDLSRLKAFVATGFTPEKPKVEASWLPCLTKSKFMFAGNVPKAIAPSTELSDAPSPHVTCAIAGTAKKAVANTNSAANFFVVFTPSLLEVSYNLVMGYICIFWCLEVVIPWQ